MNAFKSKFTGFLAGLVTAYVVMACLSIPLQAFTNLPFQRVLLIGAMAGILVYIVLSLYIAAANAREGS